MKEKLRALCGGSPENSPLNGFTQMYTFSLTDVEKLLYCSHMKLH